MKSKYYYDEVHQKYILKEEYTIDEIMKKYEKEMCRAREMEAALNHAYREMDRFKTIKTMMDKIHCDIDVWFTMDEVDKMLHLLRDYIGYLRYDLMPEINLEDEDEYMIECIEEEEDGE